MQSIAAKLYRNHQGGHSQDRHSPGRRRGRLAWRSVASTALASATLGVMASASPLTGSMGVAAAASLPAPASPAPISSPRAEQKGRWGERTTAVGADLNGDGVNDLWVADPFSSNAGQTQAGTVYAVSGASLITHTGVPQPPTVIYTINPPVPTAYQHFGFVITNIGDVNGDGVPDLAVGVDADTPTGASTGPGHVWVYSGKDGTLLYTLNNPDTSANGDRFGSRLGKAGDIYATGVGFGHDGKSEIIVGASAADNPPDCSTTHPTTICHKGQGIAYIFDGNPAAYPGGVGNAPVRILRDPDINPNASCGAGGTSGQPPCGAFGLAVQGPGDSNGDGYTDQLVGAPTYSGTAGNAQGRMYLFSGLTGSLIRRIDDPVPQAGAFFGFQDVTPNSPGDVNGDGRADIYGEGWLQNGPGGSGKGQAWVFSGKDGAVLYTMTDPHAATDGPGTQFGWSMTATTYENTTAPALYVGASPHDGNGTDQDGGTYLFASSNGSLLLDLPLPSAYQQTSTTDQGPNLGWTVSAPGSLTKDGYQTYVAGAPFWNNPTTGNVDEGLVFAFYNLPPYSRPYCPPNPDGSPTGQPC